MAPSKKKMNVGGTRSSTRLRTTSKDGSSSTNSGSGDQHRLPVDCPFPQCKASTVHQHYHQLQFFNPHPIHEVKFRGYASSQRDIPLQPGVTDQTSAMAGHQSISSNIPEAGGATQEQNGSGQPHATGCIEAVDKDNPPNGHVLSNTPGKATTTEKDSAQRAVPDKRHMTGDGRFSMDTGDPITSRQTVEFVEDLVNSQQAESETTDLGTLQQQPEETSYSIMPGLQGIADEWLVPMTPEEAAAMIP